MNRFSDIETRLERDWTGCTQRLETVPEIPLDASELHLSIAIAACLKGQHEMEREDVFIVKNALEMVRRADRAIFPELSSISLTGREKLPKDDLSALGASCTTLARQVDPDTVLDRWATQNALELDPEGMHTGFLRISLTAGYVALGVAREIDDLSVNGTFDEIVALDFSDIDLRFGD